MKTIKLKVTGITLYAPEGYNPPNEIPDCCGAGQGLGEALIPEKIWGLRISPACHIHDYSWEVADREEFTFTNFLFLANLLILIWHGSGMAMYWVRSYRALTYFNSVQTVGKSVFRNLKHDQELAQRKDAIANEEAASIERMHQY